MKNLFLLIFFSQLLFSVSCVTNTNFDQVGSGDNKPTSPVVAPQVVEVPSIGIKNYEELNLTFSFLTGVPKFDLTSNAFRNIYFMLPSENGFESFSYTMQMAIMSLASEYCHQLLATKSYAEKVWKSFDPELNFGINFNDNSKKENFIQEMLEKFWPGESDEEINKAKLELNKLFTDLTAKTLQTDSPYSVALNMCAVPLSSIQVTYK